MIHGRLLESNKQTKPLGRQIKKISSEKLQMRGDKAKKTRGVVKNYVDRGSETRTEADGPLKRKAHPIGRISKQLS